MWGITSGKGLRIRLRMSTSDPKSPADSVERYAWSRLNHLQVGRYAEYFVKMEFTLFGFQVYTSEVDDHGIDFVTSKDSSRFYQVQVKSIRGLNYIFFPKRHFALRDTLLAAVVVFHEGKSPELYLIPALAWNAPNALLVSRDYEGSSKSNPEWGLNLSSRNQGLLNKFAFERVVSTL